MPFDAMSTVASGSLSVLEVIGLVPVPKATLTKHKVKVRNEYYAGHRNVPLDQAVWREHPDFVFRAAQTPMYDWVERHLGPIPDAVKTVVAEAEHRMKEAGVTAERVLGRFDTDPYILLHYGDGEKVCLAIWDNGKVIAIAKFID